jgi:hypothetical protein
VRGRLKKGGPRHTIFLSHKSSRWGFWLTGMDSARKRDYRNVAFWRVEAM